MSSVTTSPGRTVIPCTSGGQVHSTPVTAASADMLASRHRSRHTRVIQQTLATAPRDAAIHCSSRFTIGFGASTVRGCLQSADTGCGRDIEPRGVHSSEAQTTIRGVMEGSGFGMLGFLPGNGCSESPSGQDGRSEKVGDRRRYSRLQVTRVEATQSSTSDCS